MTLLYPIGLKRTVSARHTLTKLALIHMILLYLRFLRNVIDCIIPIYLIPSTHIVHMVNSSTLMAALAPASPSTLIGNWPRLPRRNLKRPRGLWKARRRMEPAASASSPAPSCQQQTSGGGGGRASRSSARGSDTDREEEEREMMMMMDESGDDDGNCDEGDDDDDDMSQGSSSSKRQRRDSGSSGHHHLLTERQRLWADLDNTNKDTPASPPPSGVVVVLLEDEGVRSSPRPRPRPRRPMISNMITTSIAENATSSPPSSSSSSSRQKETFEFKDWEELKETLARASELYDRACSFSP